MAEQQTAAAQRDASDLQQAGGGGEAAGQAAVSGEALLRFLHERLKMKDVATAQCNLRSAALEVCPPPVWVMKPSNRSPHL